jgi:hypothetical protein
MDSRFRGDSDREGMEKGSPGSSCIKNVMQSGGN